VVGIWLLGKVTWKVFLVLTHDFGSPVSVTVRVAGSYVPPLFATYCALEGRSTTVLEVFPQRYQGMLLPLKHPELRVAVIVSAVSVLMLDWLGARLSVGVGMEDFQVAVAGVVYCTEALLEVAVAVGAIGEPLGKKLPAMAPARRAPTLKSKYIEPL
jgi:hypothetical protein